MVMMMFGSNDARRATVMITLLLGAATKAATPVETARIQAVTEVLILSKPAAPFSILGSFEYAGYSIDMVEEISLRLFSSTPRVVVEMMVDNNDIIENQAMGLNSTRCNPIMNPQRLCIGAAAISVTSSRSEKADFLTVYFMSGLLVLTRVRADYAETIGLAVAAILELFGQMIGIIAFVFLVITPIAWVCEIANPNPNSIFYPAIPLAPTDKETDIAAGEPKDLVKVSPDGVEGTYEEVQNHENKAVDRHISEDEAESYVLKKSLINALIWAASTFGGSDLAKPVSTGAQYCGYILMGFHQLVVIMTTAGAAALLAADLESTPKAGTLSELGAMGLTICVPASSPVIMTFIESNNKNDAKVYTSDGFAGMMSDLWAGKCDAVIYDGPLLEKALSDAQKKGDGLGFGLVGKALNKDPYGFLLPKDHPLFEAVNKATIDVVRDIEYNQMLDKKYLEHAYDQSTAEDEGTLLTLVFVPLGVILLIALLVYLYYKRKEDEVRHSIQIAVAETKRPLSEKIKSTQQELKNIGKADIAMVPSQDLVHGIALELHDVKKLVCELLVQQSEANAVHVSAP